MAFNNAEVWLMLAREGGRWTAGEVAERIELDQNNVANSLRTMTEAGTVQRWERTEGVRTSRVRFGVTAECSVPRGITMRQISDALAGVDDDGTTDTSGSVASPFHPDTTQRRGTLAAHPYDQAGPA